MVKPWKRIRSQTNQTYRIFSIRTDTTLSPRTGAEHEFYVIESGDWVNVIPITAGEQVVMIRQYRHGSGEITLEIPGGLVEPGDTPEKAASRELLEETGYHAAEMRLLLSSPTSAGMTSETVHLFHATGLTRRDDGGGIGEEQIVVHHVPLPGLRDWLAAREAEGSLIDFKIHAALWQARMG